MSSSTRPPSGTNVAVVVGTLARPPVRRTLPSGAELVQLEVTIRAEGAAAETVPVAWFDPPAAADGWPAGHEVVAVGRIRRRFFRAGAGTGSRTELVAAHVVPASRRAAAARAVRAALAGLTETTPTS